VYCGTVFDLDSRGQSDCGRHFITNRLYTASAEDMADFGGRGITESCVLAENERSVSSLVTIPKPR